MIYNEKAKKLSLCVQMYALYLLVLFRKTGRKRTFVHIKRNFSPSRCMYVTEIPEMQVYTSSNYLFSYFILHFYVGMSDIKIYPRGYKKGV